MNDHYLLYIDVLGFADLVEKQPERVEDLFQIVASLNVHDHPSFSAVVFSDTILVHNILPPSSDHDREYFVMFQCEFFQDLLQRLAGRDISLRAVLTYGPFEHYLLNGIHYFYGTALNRAYHADKSLPLTGLVMDSHCLSFSKVFSTRPFGDWHYVFVTQALDEWEDTYGGMTPLPWIVIHDTDLGWQLGPWIEVIACSARHAKEHHDPSVRSKHSMTLELYRNRYPQCFRTLEPANFQMEAVNRAFPWPKVRELMHQRYALGVERQMPSAGEHSNLRRSPSER